ncbi:MAG: AraC family transcriptional regulator [Angelakisella sp.]
MLIESTSSVAIRFAGNETCIPGHFFGPAVRAHYLMHFIISGEGVYKTEYGQYHLKQGDCFLIRPGQVTYYEADRNNPWEYSWVAFDGYDIRHVLENTAFKGGSEIATVTNYADALGNISKIVQLFLQSPQMEFRILSAFYAFLDTIRCDSSDSSQQDFEFQYYQRAFQYIAQNYSYPVKISEVANHVGVDRSYLYKLFIKFENCSPKQCLLEFRLKAAKNMLADPQYSITQTAYSCGFNDTASFCKQFRKSSGITPTAFRNQLTNKY